MMMTIMIIDLS